MIKIELLSPFKATIPKEVINELRLTPGDTVVFQSYGYNEVRIGKGNENIDTIHSESRLTENEQVIIPERIRKELKLVTGDFLIFNSLNSSIYFRKQGEMIACPACKGIGSFEESNLPCFLCAQQGYIENHENSLLYLSLFFNEFRKYKVAFSLINQERGENGLFKYRRFPKLRLVSNVYPESLLNDVQDSLQMILVEEYAPKSIENPTKFMIPNENQLNEILDLFVTNEAKMKVEELFSFSKAI